MHSNITYKYLLKVFYNKTNKKDNKLPIGQNNVRYTNKITMKDEIILKKANKKKTVKKFYNPNCISKSGLNIEFC